MRRSRLPKKPRRRLRFRDEKRAFVEDGRFKDDREELSERLRGMGYNVLDADARASSAVPSAASASWTRVWTSVMF